MNKSGVLIAIRARDSAYKQFTQTRAKNEWDYYKTMRNRVVNTIRTEKCKYLTKTIDQCKFKPKLMWKELKKLIGNKQNELYNDVGFENDQGAVKSISGLF